MKLGYQSMLQGFKEQPYVYGYRVRLFLLKFDLAKSLQKKYIDFSLKRTRREVEKLGELTVESIAENRLLSKHRYTLLYALCRFLKPQTVVETGVGMGVSSYFILQALQDNGFGELYSIDYPGSTYSSDAGIKINEGAYTSQNGLPGCLVPDDLRKHWTLILGKSEDKLHPLCEHLGEVDLFFHDSEHTYQNMLEEYETVWPYIQENGILASHDIGWNNAFGDFSTKNHCAPILSQNGFGLIIRNNHTHNNR